MMESDGIAGPGRRARGTAGLRAAGAALAGLLLAGCAGQPETAWELMQQQKQAQAMIRQHEDDMARRRAPSQPAVMLSMIRETQAQGRYFASLAYIEAHEQQFGDSPELAVLRADALRMTGQPVQSEAAYRALLSGSQAAHGWHGLGLLAAARGDYAQAVADMSRAVRLAPTDALMQSDLGYASLRAGDPAGARLPLGKAAELAPGNHKVLANLALLLLVEGDRAGAQRIMDQAALGPEAREQVQALAQELRMTVAQGDAVRAAGAAQAPRTVIAGDDGPHAAQAAGYAAPAVRPAVVPVDQQRLLERFGNPILR